MAVKKSILRAVLSVFPVDMSIINKVLVTKEANNSQQISFDLYEGGSEIALKGNFAQQSNVVNKDGHKTITVNPMQVNERVADSIVNVNKVKIGQNETGDQKGLSASETSAIEDEIKGFAKLKKRALRLIKKSLYDILTSGKVTVSQDGVVTDEIDFGMTNIIVNDNATAGQYQWNDTTNSDPISQLETEALEMGDFVVDTFVLGSEARKAFLAHPKVRTSDNTTTGKRANFLQGTADERNMKSTKKFKFLGTTAGDSGVALEIYAELDQYIVSGAKVDYLDKNFAVGFSDGSADNAQLQYGAIPIATGEGESASIQNFVGAEWIDGEIKKDPAVSAKYYRSSPLPVMNQPKAFISMKATLIA